MSEKAVAVRNEAVRVLVVDDSLVIRKVIEKKLKHEFDLVMAEDGEAGWEILRQDDCIRVLVTDMEMPRLDGYGFISRIRASEDARMRDIPIIAITGAEDEESKERAFACGTTDFVVKPIDTMQLLARVHALAKLNIATRQLVESQAALQDQATLDPLTQLSSRRYFQQRCDQDLAYAVRHGQDFSLLRLEIDNFKSIYQQHGDGLVDELLVWLAAIFMATCRREDTVARIGGAEFAVLAPGTGRDKAQVLCRRLCAAVVAQAFVSGEKEIPVTLSLGAVTLDEGAKRNFVELMEIAERRVRRARVAGGNRVVAADEAAPETREVLPEIAAEISPETSAPAVSEIPALPEMAEQFNLEPDALLTLAFDADQASKESVPAATVANTRSETADAERSETFGLDQALKMLARGEGERLAPWLDRLVQRLLPLLEFYNERRDGELASLITQVRTTLRRRA